MYTRKVGAATLGAAVRRAIMKTAETKEITNSQAAAQVTLGGQVFLLNNIAEGTEINQRVGRHITPKGCDVQVQVTTAGANLVDGTYVALVWDKQPDNTTPAYNVIFDTASSATLSMGFKNTLQYRDRFQILWEERSIITDNGVAAAGLDFENIWYRKYHELVSGDHKCEYLSNAAVTPSVGGLYLCVITIGQVAGPTNVTFAYTSKFTYTDF